MWSSPSAADLELDDVTVRLDIPTEPPASSDWRSRTLRSATAHRVVDPAVAVEVVEAAPLTRRSRLLRLALALAGR